MIDTILGVHEYISVHRTATTFFFFTQPDRIDYYRRQYCGIDSLLCPSPICQFHRFVYVARAAEAIGCSTFGYIDGVAIEELFKSSMR